MSRTEGSDGGMTTVRTSRHPAATLVCLLALALPAACGGDDSDTEITAAQSSPTTASTAEPAQSSSSTPAPPSVASSSPSPAVGAASSTPTQAPAKAAAPSSSTAAPATSDERAEAAIADLASRKGYARSEISVVRVESVTWPDGALGCPTKDGQYTQAIVEGYRIILAWKGVEYRYHGAVGALPFWCQYLDQ